MVDKEVNTGGGPVIEKDVHTGRDFIGRDRVKTNTNNFDGNAIVAMLAVLVVGIISVIVIIRNENTPIATPSVSITTYATTPLPVAASTVSTTSHVASIVSVTDVSFPSSMCHPQKDWLCVGKIIEARYGIGLYNELDDAKQQTKLFDQTCPPGTIFEILGGPELKTSENIYLFRLEAVYRSVDNICIGVGWAPDFDRDFGGLLFTHTPKSQQIQWLPDRKRICVDDKCKEFFLWEKFKKEVEEKIFTKVPQVLSGSTLALKDSYDKQNWFMEVIGSSGNKIGDVWIGNDPTKDWKFDGLVRVGVSENPVVVWDTFQRYSDGSYKKK